MNKLTVSMILIISGTIGINKSIFEKLRKDHKKDSTQITEEQLRMKWFYSGGLMLNSDIIF